MTDAVLVLAGPAAAAALLAVLPPLRRSGKPAAAVSLAGISVSLAASAALFARIHAAGAPSVAEIVWAPMTKVPSITFGILADGISASMAVMVAFIALAVQVYSLAYMGDEKPAAFGRYYAYHSLFAFAMLGLVLSHNLLQTYVFWELVGLGSYLLIGFWFEKPEACRAAVKAFWTTRLGDVGFALGIVVLWSAAGTFTFSELFAKVGSGALGGAALTLGVAGIYLGAMGKSAQFPFHIWLPDAMEGPTPVSALIHAATMVAAGVYLMVRIAPLLAHTPQVASAVYAIGVLTAILAASMALVENDIKRILAFSTVSQLGFMMAAVGAGGAEAAYFHLLTHALFKALLFLAAGSLIHAVHTNDIFKMGNLSRAMPVTCATFAAGALALSGVFPTAGFFSKDEVLAAVLRGGHPVGFAVLILTTAMTAFYIGRAFFVAAMGGNRAAGHPHEPPVAMKLPLIVLAVLAVVAGVAAASIPGFFAASIAPPDVREGHAPILVPVAGTLAALTGLAIAWAGYQARRFAPAAVRAAFPRLTSALEHRWYVDDVFEAVYRFGYRAGSKTVAWVDRYVVDGIVNAVTWLTWTGAGRLTAIQNGRVQDALYATAAGLVLLAWLAWAR
jgi:NADH-quinone oxidoreductase subunit L